LGGSADLTPSNNTKAKNQIEIRPGEYKGSYVHYGVREHGMAATMNGIALHGGLIPYGGTFLCFSDYCRPAIRLAAMMDIRTIFVMTHDSIGLREDGPTHQPMPLLRREAGIENRSARGAYVLIEAEDGPRKVTLMATGSELRLAVEARAVLQQEGIPTAVVSVPCTLIFNEQDAAYQQAVLGDTLARVAVEAAVQMSWDRYLGLQGCFVGMRGFGESGKICRCLQEVRHHHRSGGARRPRESEIGLRSIGTSWFRRAQFCQYKEGRHDQRIATTRQHRSRRLVGRSQSDADKIWKAGRAGRARWGRRGHHQPHDFRQGDWVRHGL
jgi:transketolase